MISMLIRVTSRLQNLSTYAIMLSLRLNQTTPKAQGCIYGTYCNAYIQLMCNTSLHPLCVYRLGYATVHT